MSNHPIIPSSLAESYARRDAEAKAQMADLARQAAAGTLESGRHHGALADYDPDLHAEAIRQAADAEGADHHQWFGDGPADWEQVWERIESATGIDLGSDEDGPAMRLVRRAYAKAKREAS